LVGGLLPSFVPALAEAGQTITDSDVPAVVFKGNFCRLRVQERAKQAKPFWLLAMTEVKGLPCISTDGRDRLLDDICL
jgi:hypothetical protein